MKHYACMEASGFLVRMAAKYVCGIREFVDITVSHTGGIGNLNYMVLISYATDTGPMQFAVSPVEWRKALRHAIEEANDY